MLLCPGARKNSVPKSVREGFDHAIHPSWYYGMATRRVNEPQSNAFNTGRLKIVVAVGTTIADRPPHRSVRARLRTRLLPRMSGGEADMRIGMQNTGLRNPPVQDGEQPQRTLPPIRLRYIDSPRGLCPIRSPVHPTVQVDKSILQSGFILLPRHAIYSWCSLSL